MTLLDLHLGRPLTRGSLTLFPVWNGRAVSARGYDVGGGLAVTERSGAPVVGELVVANGGSRPVLLLEGELLQGGHQHRVTSRTTVVEPGHPVVVPVRCVEQGRWSGTRAHVRNGRRAPTSVRAARGQAGTWAEVSRYEQRYARSDTGSFLDAAAPAEASAAALVRDLEPLPFQSGVLTGVAGQPLLLEVYDSPRTLAAVWSQLLQAVALDALHAEPVPTPGRRARRFLDHVLGAATDGQGHGETAYARLDAAVWNGRSVHTVAVTPRHELVAA